MRNNYLPVFLIAASTAALILMRRKRSSDNTATLINNPQFNMLNVNSKLPRGYRNNNPLNIRLNAANAWKGKITPNTDGAFEQFSDMAYGYRAALYLLRKYIKQGYTTIGSIITRWAPPSENNTNSYINHVVNIMNDTFGRNVTPFDAISSSDADSLCQMAYAMSIIENGNTELTRTYGLPNMDAIKEGWRLL